jgi:hypothetical protein
MQWSYSYIPKYTLMGARRQCIFTCTIRVWGTWMNSSGSGQWTLRALVDTEINVWLLNIWGTDPLSTKPLLQGVNSLLSWLDRVVSIATRYGLDGKGIENRRGQEFPHQSRRPWRSPSLPYDGYRVFPGGKTAKAWRWPPTPPTAEVKERVELYIYSPSGPSWPVLGWP